jgi:hypothetical protein
VIPPDASAAFVANMEDVLEVYQRPHDPQRPLVCLDETSKQLIIETRPPIPAKPGRKARHDYEYERNGVANLFMVFALNQSQSTSESVGDKICRETACASQRLAGILPPQFDLARHRDRKRRSRPRERRGNRRLFQRPQETAFARNCVVGLAGLELATKRLWPS